MQIFRNVPASKFARPPDRPYRCEILLQGSRGFYVRAYRALLPPHAPDMLTVRIQVIDGTGTFTLSDSQPCRLLTSLHRRYPASAVLRTSPPPQGDGRIVQCDVKVRGRQLRRPSRGAG